MGYNVVDLKSDTVTLPTESMRHAMATCELGDDVYGEDPTVNALEKYIAEYFGKDASLFVPSGTMSNLIAIMTHCDKRGADMICGNLSHIKKYEQGGASSIAGVMITTIENNEDGTFDLDKCEEAIIGSDYHEATTMMIAIENTHNMCGGKVLPLKWMNDVANLAKKYKLALHMDGARIYNALVYYDQDVKDVVRDCDSISVCFSKGLGAPVGSILIGSNDFIKRARRHRKVLGGGMRQAGVLAAAAMVALKETVPRLVLDHQKAIKFAKAVNSLNHPWFSVENEKCQTNILMVRIHPDSTVKASKLIEILSKVTDSEIKAGCIDSSGDGIVVKACSRDENWVRFTFHYDVSEEKTDLAIKKIVYVLNTICS